MSEPNEGAVIEAPVEQPVTRKDLERLQSVYDKRIAERDQFNQSLLTEVQKLREEANARVAKENKARDDAELAELDPTERVEKKVERLAQKLDEATRVQPRTATAAPAGETPVAAQVRKLFAEHGVDWNTEGIDKGEGVNDPLEGYARLANSVARIVAARSAKTTEAKAAPVKTEPKAAAEVIETKAPPAEKPPKDRIELGGPRGPGVPTSDDLSSLQQRLAKTNNNPKARAEILREIRAHRDATLAAV